MQAVLPRNPMSIHAQSVASSQHVPRKKSSFLSLRRDKERSSPSSDSGSTSNPSTPAPISKQTYFDHYPKRAPSLGSPKPRLEKSKTREHRRTSPSGSVPTFEDFLLFEKGISPTTYVFPSQDVVQDAGLVERIPFKNNSRSRTRAGPSKKNHKNSTIPPLRFSGLTQNESPPLTPVEFDNSRNSRDRYPVVVAAPISGVETMDALVDGMNGYSGDDYFNSSSSRSRFRITGHHPLYEPPLPTPPPGVVLGRRKVDKLSHSASNSITSEEDGDMDSESFITPTALPRRHASRSRPGSNSTITVPPVSQPGSNNVSPSTLKSFSEKATPPRPPPDPQPKPRITALSITEIIRAHAPLSAQVRSRPSTRPPSEAHSSIRSATLEEQESDPEPLTADEEAELVSRSSIDSVADEVQRTLRHQNKSPTAPHPLQHAQSFPNRTHSFVSDTLSVRSPEPSIYSSSAASSHHAISPYESISLPSNSRTAQTQTIARYLRSTRLTTLLKLTRSPHASGDHPLTVSLSDLGSPKGFPLVVFLGLGCVRHIMGLYDEMADCLGLRLITIDRWGLGRTDTPQSKSPRGIMEWASVVEEVLDLLHIKKCSVMAHSAGAPYALSFANRARERVVGDICLLAPWVGGGEGGGYKWLKYVPNGILKTAQAAEWKVQAWMIGKPPTIAYEGIGFELKTSSPSPSSRSSKATLSQKVSVSRREYANLAIVYPSTDRQPRPSIASSTFSDYDDLRDFEGRFESRSTLSAKRDTQRGDQDTSKLRKTSRGFLEKLKGSPHSQPQSPAEEKVPMAPGKRLKALRSMGSLKGKSSNGASKRSSGVPSPQLPQSLAFDGLGINDIDWTKSVTSEMATPISMRYMRSKGRPSTSEMSVTSTGSRSGGRRSISFTASRSTPPSIPSSPVPSLHTTPPSSYTNSVPGDSYQAHLGNALIAASHAESAKGTHTDLLQILNHDHQPWGFSYTAYPHKVRIWYGDKDEKIAENAVRWMERNMGEGRCHVKVVKGADHSLMYKSAVVVEVLEGVVEGVRDYW